MIASVTPPDFDPSMPQLRSALDAQLAGAALRRHLRGGGGTLLQLDECRVERVRYRPGERCIIQYRLGLVATDDRRPTEVIVTGTLYGRPQRAAQRAARFSELFVPELQMLVRMFPSDRKLIHAAQLADPDDGSLRSHVMQSFGPGRWRVTQWDRRVERYREGLSLVVRYDVTAYDPDTAESRSRRFFAKAYPDADMAARSFSLVNALAAHSNAVPVSGRIDPPAAHLGHLHAILFAATPGASLAEILESSPRADCETAVASTARTLAAFHRSAAPTPRRYTCRNYAESLDRPARALLNACPQLGSAIGSVVAAAGTLAEMPLCPTHRDLKPEHVLIDDGSVAWIDLDSCATADPLLDVALMAARLSLHRVAPGSGLPPTHARLFIQQYRLASRCVDAGRLAVLVAAAMTEAAASLFYRQAPNWRELIPMVMHRSTAVLRGLSALDASGDPVGPH